MNQGINAYELNPTNDINNISGAKLLNIIAPAPNPTSTINGTNFLLFELLTFFTIVETTKTLINNM